MLLHQLDSGLKSILFAVVVVLVVGVSTGLAYLGVKGGTTPAGAERHYRGDIAEDPQDVPEHYPMPIDQLLVITHTHIVTFALVFGIMGILVWHTPSSAKLRLFLAVEPIWGTLLTFGSIWLVRFVHPNFSWLLATSGMLMYSCFYVGAFLVVRDLTRAPTLPN